MFGRATITLGIGPHSSYYYTLWKKLFLACYLIPNFTVSDDRNQLPAGRLSGSFHAVLDLSLLSLLEDVLNLLYQSDLLHCWLHSSEKIYKQKYSY